MYMLNRVGLAGPCVTPRLIFATSAVCLHHLLNTYFKSLRKKIRIVLNELYTAYYTKGIAIHAVPKSDDSTLK